MDDATAPRPEMTQESPAPQPTDTYLGYLRDVRRLAPNTIESYARRFGYGAAPNMTRRCLERVDEEQIFGELRILRVLSDTHPVATQGPVWYLDGRSV